MGVPSRTAAACRFNSPGRPRAFAPFWTILYRRGLPQDGQAMGGSRRRPVELYQSWRAGRPLATCGAEFLPPGQKKSNPQKKKNNPPDARGDRNRAPPAETRTKGIRPCGDE